MGRDRLARALCLLGVACSDLTGQADSAHSVGEITSKDKRVWDINGLWGDRGLAEVYSEHMSTLYQRATRTRMVIVSGGTKCVGDADDKCGDVERTFCPICSPLSVYFIKLLHRPVQYISVRESRGLVWKQCISRIGKPCSAFMFFRGRIQFLLFGKDRLLVHAVNQTWVDGDVLCRRFSDIGYTERESYTHYATRYCWPRYDHWRAGWCAEWRGWA